MNWAGIIVPIAVIAVLAVVVLIVFLYIRSRLQSFSRQAFGTENLGKAVNEIQNASETPRAVHGMTDIYLPQILRDFPEFDYEVFKGRAQGVLRSYFAAISAKDMGLLNDDCSLSLRNSVYSIIGDLEAHGYDRQLSEGTFHQTEIARYIKNGATVSIIFNISVGCYDFIQDKSGKLISGRTDRKRETVYNVALVYVQDESKLTIEGGTSLGLNCPNCGAPIKNLGQKFCDYCGTGVVEVNTRTWRFESVTEERSNAKPY